MAGSSPVHRSLSIEAQSLLVRSACSSVDGAEVLVLALFPSEVWTPCVDLAADPVPRRSCRPIAYRCVMSTKYVVCLSIPKMVRVATPTEHRVNAQICSPLLHPACVRSTGTLYWMLRLLLRGLCGGWRRRERRDRGPSSRSRVGGDDDQVGSLDPQIGKLDQIGSSEVAHAVAP